MFSNLWGFCFLEDGTHPEFIPLLSVSGNTFPAASKDLKQTLSCNFPARCLEVNEL